MKNAPSILALTVLTAVMVLFNTCTEQKTLPIVVTIPISAVSYTTAVTGGAVTDEGGSPIGSRGVCWNTLGKPTINESKENALTKGFGSFVVEISDLSPKSKYYLRAFAINSTGTSYGNEVSFSTIQSVPAILTTTSISTFDETSAVSGGNVTNDNGDPVTARGVCWSTTTGPTIELCPKTDDGPGKGVFSSSIQPLLPNTKYFIKAYAISSSGTGYGNEVIFTTNNIAVPELTTTIASLVTPVSAVSGGNITKDHGAPVTVRGVCWNTLTGPTTSLTTKTADGTGPGVFTSNLSQLTQNTTYYLRAYAINAAGTSYGNEVTFTTAMSAIPTLTTTAITSLSQTSLVSGGNITSENGSPVTARGICWNTSPIPTTALTTKTSDGTGPGSFISTITGLLPAQTYYLRAYATNSIGTAYGNEIVFSTKVADIDGNIYNTVRIGSQVWMAENLKTTRYSDNSSIPLISGYSAWATSYSQGYCWYNNDETTYKPVYGALYNWYTVDAATNGGKYICPTGWHVPTDNDWTVLVSFLGDENTTGIALKEAGIAHWLNSNSGTNSSGFTALPAGIRYTGGGAFNQIGNYTSFWSSTDNGSGLVWYRELTSWYNPLIRNYRNKSDGCSIRCIKTF